MIRRLKLAVLISGGGTTLKNLIDKNADGAIDIDFRLVISSNAKAGGLSFAEAAQIPTHVVRRKSFESAEDHSQAIFELCRTAEVDYVVMGGFLSHVLIPPDFHNRVLNTHPSLIPAFCGRGFYGHHVHQAVLEYGAKISGCTVHFVDNVYDHGPIIMQRPVPVEFDDTPDTLQKRIFAEECLAYPEVLRLLAAGRVTADDRAVRIAKDDSNA